MKKAFIVNAYVATRVVIDVPDDFDTREVNTGKLTDNEWDKIVIKSLPRLKDNLYFENVDDIFEDTECPYDAEWDEE